MISMRSSTEVDYLSWRTIDVRIKLPWVRFRNISCEIGYGAGFVVGYGKTRCRQFLSAIVKIIELERHRK